jgi:Domain of unknown function (DUF4382)
MKISYPSLLWAATLALVLWGCGGSDYGSGSASGPVGGTGALRVSLTDAAPCGYDKVYVTVSKVRVHQSSNANENDAGWSDINLSSPQKIDLTSLVNGTLHELGQAALPAGHYTQLRLMLVANSPSDPLNNSVIPVGGIETPLKTPSGVQSGLKLIRPFDVPPDTLVDIVLDFDACRSIVNKGNGGYGLKPVISVTPMVISGQIAGFVDPALSNPMVYAEQAGEVVKATIPDATTGSFILSPLPESSTAGDYDVVITADNAATAMIQSVPVTTQGITMVSTDTDPIMLAGSAVHTVSGTIAPKSAETTIRATQTFSSGPTMEVRSISATGSYSLTLPIEAPSLGSYGSLPIALTADGALAGQYQLEASAEGFSTQTVPVDISGGDTMQDFTLMP